MWFDPSTLFANVSPPANSANPANYRGSLVGKLAELAKLATTPEPANDVLPVTTTPSTWWRLHYSDREPLEVWTDPPATCAEMLARHPEAIAAEPTSPPPAPPPACRTCLFRPPRHRDDAPIPCGDPVAARLSDVPGVILYHPDGGAGCVAWLARLEPDLEQRIRAMAARWQYTDEELNAALNGAKSDPDGWRAVVKADENSEVTR